MGLHVFAFDPLRSALFAVQSGAVLPPSPNNPGTEVCSPESVYCDPHYLHPSFPISSSSFILVMFWGKNIQTNLSQLHSYILFHEYLFPYARRTTDFQTLYVACLWMHGRKCFMSVTSMWSCLMIELRFWKVRGLHCVPYMYTVFASLDCWLSWIMRACVFKWTCILLSIYCRNVH